VAEVIRKAPKDKAFKRVEAALAVTKPSVPRAMGRREGVLDNGVTKLRAIDRGTVH
jgi:hypothetical protein